MIRVPCGQSSTPFGSIHGCIAVGISLCPSRSSVPSASATLAWNASASPASERLGPLHLSSTTCSASSLFHATSPFSHSSVSLPATDSRSRSAAGTTSRPSSATIMYSSSTPTTSNREYGPLCGSGLLGGIHSRLEDLHDPVVQLVAEHDVLDAVIEIRVVVDLDQHRAPADDLDVDAVEPVADRVRRPEREVDDLRRRVVDRQRLRVSLLAARPLRRVMIDLPVPLRHEVAAREERLAVEDADAPVEVRRQERLHDDEVAAREELREARRELVARLGAEDAFRERAVRLLQHARQAELGDDVVRLPAVDDERRRDRQVQPLRELEQIHLVAAANDRLGVVDHDEPLAARPAREAVRVMIDVRRLADEERVELREPAVVVTAEELHVEAVRTGRALEPLQRLAVR